MTDNNNDDMIPQNSPKATAQQTASPDTRINDGEDLPLADAEDIFFAKRDDSGEPVPVRQRIPGEDRALEVVPPTEGYYNEFLDPLPTDQDLDKDRENEKVAEMLSKGFPALDPNREDVEDGLLVFGLEAAEEMLLRAGGMDMYTAIQEQQQQQEMGQVQTMMNAMGVSGDMSAAEFMQAMQDFEPDEGDGDADGEGGMSPGPARPNGP